MTGRIFPVKSTASRHRSENHYGYHEDEEAPGIQVVLNEFRLSSSAIRPHFPIQPCPGVFQVVVLYHDLNNSFTLPG